ncbi:MAG: hypothetical protein WD810_02760 [Solirubrobacterales bacterium]
MFAALFVAAPSATAAVFQLTADTRAEHPDIAVEEGGTAHVAWSLSAGIPGDDQLVYCRVPRGAKACDLTHVIALPRTDFDGPQVVLTRSGEIVLASTRCCLPAAPVYAVSSGDGGQSFGSPVKIADEFSGGSDWQAVLGPGDFSLALSGGNSGPDFASIWRAAPLDGGNPEPKAELAPFPKAYFTSTGFPAPTTPIAAYTDLDDVYLRRWAGSGDYNAAATWTPEAYVVHGTEPKLASGPRGVFLVYRGAKPPYQYFTRRFDGEDFPRATQKVVSDPSTGESAIFRDFFEDGGGNLHATFRQRSEQGDWGLRHRVSVDGGKNWKPVEILAARRAAEDLFNLSVGADPDGIGAVVGDHNGEGPVWFTPFGPSGGGGGACPPTVKLGKAIARALEGCFKRQGDKYVATGAVKVNGVDVEPLGGGGGGARASAAFHVTAVPGQRTLTTSGKANVRVGNVVLERGPVAWKLPAGNGKVVRLNSPDGSVFRDLGKFAKKLFEFPVDGDAELLIAGAGAKVPTSFRMPGLLGGVTGETTLRTDQAGLVLGGMKIDVPTAAIGLLRIAGIDVTYDGQNRFTGTAKIELPPAYSKPVTVTFAFEDGELSRLEIEPAIQFTPPLAIVGSPPTPLVGLDSLGFAYLRKPASRLFQGNLFLIAGPKLFGFQVADLDGSVALEFPVSGPTTLRANGDLSVVRLPLANAFATYTVGAPGSFEFGGSFQVLAISGSVKGFVDLASGHFSASGGASLGPLGGQAVITNKGMGACIDNPLGPDPGVSWKWGDPLPEAGCPGPGTGGARLSAAAGVIRASVGGKGRRRSVRFRAPRRAGQRITFAEEAKRVYREIGSTGKSRGTLSFRPASGPGGKRRIVAIVEQDGVPYEKLTVARYAAPATPRPARPRRVVVRRRGGRLIVGWSRVRGVSGYEVRVSLPRDGRRLLFFPSPRKRGVRVSGVERSDLARVTVAAIGRDLRTGRAAKATVKPAGKRRRG